MTTLEWLRLAAYMAVIATAAIALYQWHYWLGRCVSAERAATRATAEAANAVAIARLFHERMQTALAQEPVAPHPLTRPMMQRKDRPS